MSRHFSPQQLSALRNHIPIDILIEQVLAIPTRRTDGYFRFNCPVCDRFHTAVNPKENLARCFHCQKNFNPIDMVMCRQKIGFIESVDFLKQLSMTKPQLKSEEALGHDSKTEVSPSRILWESSRLPTPGANNTTVHSLGQILSKIAPTHRLGALNDENIAHHRNLIRRIEILEQKVAMLLKLSSAK